MTETHAPITLARSWPSPKAALELLKPITWFAPMWALGCGVVSSGVPLEGRWSLVFGAVLLAGPMVCGTSQAANDWFDRHEDRLRSSAWSDPQPRSPKAAVHAEPHQIVTTRGG